MKARPSERNMAMAVFGGLCMFAGAMLYRTVAGAGLPASASAAPVPIAQPINVRATQTADAHCSFEALATEPTGD